MSIREELDALEHLTATEGWRLLEAWAAERARSLLIDLLDGAKTEKEYAALSAEHRTLDAVLAWPRERAQAIQVQIQGDEA